MSPEGRLWLRLTALCVLPLLAYVAELGKRLAASSERPDLPWSWPLISLNKSGGDGSSYGELP